MGGLDDQEIIVDNLPGLLIDILVVSTKPADRINRNEYHSLALKRDTTGNRLEIIVNSGGLTILGKTCHEKGIKLSVAVIVDPRFILIPFFITIEIFIGIHTGRINRSFRNTKSVGVRIYRLGNQKS